MQMVTWLRRKRAHLILAAVGASVLWLIYLFLIKTPAFKVSIDGQEVFTVKDKDEIFLKVATIKGEYRERYGEVVEERGKVTYERVFVDADDLVTAEQAGDLLESMLCFDVQALAVVINGEPVTYIQDAKAFGQVLEQMKSDGVQLAEGEVLKEVNFKEHIEVRPAHIDADAVLSVPEAATLLKNGKVAPKKHVVEAGDSLWSIARANDLLVKDILDANPNLKENEILALGQEINLVKTEPYINVVAQVAGEKKVEIPYETKVVNDKNAGRGIYVKQIGENGEKQITYIDTRVNGVVTSHQVLEEKIIKAPVESVVVKGPQAIQVASRGTGGVKLSYWPVRGTISQPFKGRRHTGLDIALKSGSPLKVVDSGTVTFAGWQGGYGKFIIVDHGGGVVTRYAHCSRIDVSVGQKVSAGAVIGATGNTGRSTGPHLHFEVLVRGVFVDPMACLP